MSSETRADAGPATSAPTSADIPPTPASVGTQRFDELVQVVRPWMKLALLVSVLTIVGGLLWATFATITTSTKATGALMPSSGLVNVSTLEPGVLASWQVTEGVQVTAGQVVATLIDVTGKPLELKSPVPGTVEVVLANVGTELESRENIALVAPSASTRVVVTFLPPAQAQIVTKGQPTVVTISGCDAFSGEVSGVLTLPLTTEQMAERTGLPGIVPLISPEETGTGVAVAVPTDWCPDARYGQTGSMVITTGSTHPIQYLAPGG